MYQLEIAGGHPLRGELPVQGAKNSVLPILTAVLLAPGESVIHNCPDLSDVAATLEILRGLGCSVRREGDTVTVDAAGLTGASVSRQLMEEMRSSVLFLGALLGRLGQAELSYPGGCQLGPRPIDLHLAALRSLGAEIREEQGLLMADAGAGLRGRTVCLPTPSVGATENVMLAACGARGVTTLVGAAREPEIVDLQGLLNRMGGEVRGAGGSVIQIRGGRPLHPTEYTVMSDRIAAATYLCAAAAAGGAIRLTAVEPGSLTAVLSCLEEGGCRIRTGRQRIDLVCRRPFGGLRTVRTAPYPGFPTDAQPLLMAALAAGQGTTMIEENLFDNRYRHVDELARMGADIRLSGRVAVVTGQPLHAAPVCSTDLRGGAALAVAALAAEGTSRIGGLGYIQRGYQNLQGDLSRLGAEVRLVEEAPELLRKGQERTYGVGTKKPKTEAETQPAQRAV